MSIATQKVLDIQKNLELDVAEIKKIEAGTSNMSQLSIIEYVKVEQAKQSLQEKKNENELVLQEFNTLEEGAAIYKLVGPVLAKQDLNDARSNVQKRIEFISKEIARMENLVNEFQTKVEDRRKNIMKAQQDYQKLMAQAQQQAQPAK